VAWAQRCLTVAVPFSRRSAALTVRGAFSRRSTLAESGDREGLLAAAASFQAACQPSPNKLADS